MERSDWVTIHMYAKMVMVSTRTVSRWIKSEPDIFEGRVKRENQTVFIRRGTLEDLKKKYTV